MRVASWSTSSCPKMMTKATTAMPSAIITSPVASPRFIFVASGAIAGSMAIAANQDMSTVKMTVPPSSIRNLRNVAIATTASSVHAMRQMLRGENRTTPRPVLSGSGGAIAAVPGSCSVMALLAGPGAYDRSGCPSAAPPQAFRSRPARTRASRRTPSRPTTTGTPQSCWCTWHAGNSAAPGPRVVARRRADRHVQHARRPPSATTSSRSRSGAAAGARHEQLGRRRRHDQVRRRAVPVVELLTGRRGEQHLERQRPGEPRRWARAACGTPPAPTSSASSGSARRVSRCAADSTTSRTWPRRRRPRPRGRSARRARSRASSSCAPPGRSGGPRRCRCRRPRPSRRAARRRRAGAGAARRPRGRRAGRSRTARADRGRARRRSRTRRSAEVSESASQSGRRRRSRPARRSARTTPAASAPSTSPSLVVPAYADDPRPSRVEASRAGGRRPSRRRPGRRTRRRPTGWTARSSCARTGRRVALHPLRARAGERRARSHVAGVEPAQRVVDGVGDHDVVPRAGGHLGRQQAQAVRLGEAGRAGGAVDEAALAVADRGAARSRRRRRARPASGARCRRPAACRRGSTSTLPGKRSAPRLGSGGDVRDRRRGAACPSPRARRRARRPAGRARARGPRRLSCATT